MGAIRQSVALRTCVPAHGGWPFTMSLPCPSPCPVQLESLALNGSGDSSRCEPRGCAVGRAGSRSVRPGKRSAWLSSGTPCWASRSGRSSRCKTHVAEDAGFDFVAFSDHYFPWLAEQGHSPYVWSVLDAAAQVTNTIPLMTVRQAVPAADIDEFCRQVPPRLRGVLGE